MRGGQDPELGGSQQPPMPLEVGESFPAVPRRYRERSSRIVAEAAAAMRPRSRVSIDEPRASACARSRLAVAHAVRSRATAARPAVVALHRFGGVGKALESRRGPPDVLEVLLVTDPDCRRASVRTTTARAAQPVRCCRRKLTTARSAASSATERSFASRATRATRS